MLLEQALTVGREQRKRIARRSWGTPPADGQPPISGAYIDLFMDSNPRGFVGFVLTVEDLDANDWEIYWLDRE